MDGNPGRPIRVSDLLFVPGKICWLAYCSGPCLKREGRLIPLPDDLWKELLPATWQTSEKTTVFMSLACPKRLWSTQKTNAWELRLTAKGKITGIGEGAEPRIPAEERKAGG